MIFMCHAIYSLKRSLMLEELYCASQKSRFKMRMIILSLLQLTFSKTCAKMDCLWWRNRSISTVISKQTDMPKLLLKLIDDLNWRKLVLHINDRSDEMGNGFVYELIESHTPRLYQMLAWTDEEHCDLWGSRAGQNGDIEHVYTHLIVCNTKCTGNVFKAMSASGSSKFLRHSRWIVITDQCNVTGFVGHIGELENIAILMPHKRSNIPPFKMDNRSHYADRCTSPIDVYTLRKHGATMEFQPVKEWPHCQQQSVAELTRIMFPDVNNGLNGRTLRVGVGEWDPFLMKTKEHGETIFRGQTVDILEEMARRLNFRYELVEDPHGDWGELVNGSWTGLINMLITHDIDVIGVPYWPKEDRMKVMDFSYPVIVTPVRGHYKKPTDSELRWRVAMDVFDWIVLVLMITCLLVVSFLLSMLENYYPKNNLQKPAPVTSRKFGDLAALNFWKLFGNMLNQGYSGHSLNIHRHGSVSARTVFASWCLFCLIIAVIYAAHLISGLGVVQRRVPFRSLQELVNQQEYQWGFSSKSFASIFSKNDSKKLYREIWRGVMQFSATDPDVLSDSDSMQQKKMEGGGYVYISDSLHMAPTVANNCDIGYINEPLLVTTSSMAFSKNSLYTDIFSQQILSLHENGLLKFWQKKWVPRQKECSQRKTDASAIDLLTVQSVFYLLAFGITLSIVTFMGETLQRTLRRRYACIKCHGK